MGNLKSSLLGLLSPAADVLLLGAVVPSAMVLKAVRRANLKRLRLCRETLIKIGVIPVRNHYYEPFFDPRALHSLEAERSLPGIELNEDEQLAVLSQLTFSTELLDLPKENRSPGEFNVNNYSFGSGDFELWYNMIRLRKPRRIIEVGSGMSTLIASMAIKRNMAEDSSYSCQLTCVEPYEQPWLESTGAEVLRKRVEELDSQVFSSLERNDVLFIDSSHVIRPQGDVLFQYLRILPSLQNGVIVHVHDIFTPRDYPSEWLRKELRLWNEQYLLEAFLSCNKMWKIVAAANYLRHRHYDALKACCPYLTTSCEPGSFYMMKVE